MRSAIAASAAISAPCQRKWNSACPTAGTSAAVNSLIGRLPGGCIEQPADLFALVVGHVRIERGEDQVLAGAGECFLDEVGEQIGLKRVLRLRRGIDVGTLAFITSEQTLAVHHLH